MSVPDVPKVEFVSIRSRGTIPYLGRVITGELMAHEVSFGEDHFGIVFVPTRSDVQEILPAEEPKKSFFGRVLSKLGLSREVPTLPIDPNAPTDFEKNHYVDLVDDACRQAGELDREPLFYIQQMSRSTAERLLKSIVESNVG